MIDLDNAQDVVSGLTAEEGGWDGSVRIGGGVLLLAHPDRMPALTVRRGVLPLLWRAAIGLWRMIVGTTDEAALRREVVGLLEPEDRLGRRHVASLGVWQLLLVQRAQAAAVARLLNEAVGRAVRAPEPHGGTAAPRHGPAGAEPGGASSLSQTLRPGGGRLPGFMGGGLWGKAYADELARKRAENDAVNHGAVNKEERHG